jgi:hypothetical protein
MSQPGRETLTVGTEYRKPQIADRVPKGRLKVAQDDSPGYTHENEPVPLGTAEILRVSFSKHAGSFGPRS